MKMINELDVDNRVAGVYIRFINQNIYDEQIIVAMINRYHNIYGVNVYGSSDTIDIDIHSMI